MLNVISHGAATDAPPLVIAHGLFGSGRNWSVIAKRLSDQRQVLAVDMRNHGMSLRAESHRYPDLAEDLAGVIRAHGGQADLLGHSMGGKAAMALALSEPALVRHLIVADIAPVAYDHSQNHLIEAMRAVDLAPVAKRSDADAQLAQSVEDASLRAFLLQSLDVTDRRWRLNLEALQREMAHITGWHSPEGTFEGRALFLVGAASDYVLPEHRDLIRSRFPRAMLAKIPGAGHWLHAEKPREFEAAVRAFLNR